MTTSTFTINGMFYAYAVDALIVYVDSQPYDRAYECAWTPERMSVLAHWGYDCEPTTTPLLQVEAHILERFLDASDDCADAYARLSSEPAPVHGSRRSA